MVVTAGTDVPHRARSSFAAFFHALPLDSFHARRYTAASSFGLRPFGASAQVAQLVEHATENRSVGGSIPPLGTIASVSI